MMMGVGKRLGIMPISVDTCYIFATSNEPANPRFASADFGKLMQKKFADFRGPAEGLLAEMGPNNEPFYTAVEEVHLPLPWSIGQIGLIGDAAHASTPFMGQGGAMAVEDALVLAESLSSDLQVAQALQSFGDRRFERCSYAQEESRKVGEAGGLERQDDVRIRDQRLSAQGQADVDRFYERMAQPL